MHMCIYIYTYIRNYIKQAFFFCILGREYVTHYIIYSSDHGEYIDAKAYLMKLFFTMVTNCLRKLYYPIIQTQ
jgi:hypothetical protein